MLGDHHFSQCPMHAPTFNLHAWQANFCRWEPEAVRMTCRTLPCASRKGHGMCFEAPQSASWFSPPILSLKVIKLESSKET